jgi:DNA-binding MarR family transcriptional regulator
MASREDSNTGSIVLLTRLARVVYRASTEDLLGIKLKQLACLAYLRDHGEIAQATLADGLCADANMIVLVLNELETMEMVRRKRDPSDRRRHLVEITWSGLTALDQAEQAQSSIEDDVLAALSPEERETLRTLLHRALEGASLAEVGALGSGAL